MFLKKLYREWRTAFYAVVVFALLQAFFMYKAVETVPFFLYNMYSTPQLHRDSTTRVLVTINGTPFDPATLSGREQETLIGSFDYFERLKKNNFYATDSATISKRLKNKLPSGLFKSVFGRLTNRSVNDSVFLEWWGRYLSEVSGRRVDAFTIVRSSVAWTPAPVLLHDTLSYYSHGKME